MTLRDEALCSNGERGIVAVTPGETEEENKWDVLCACGLKTMLCNSREDAWLEWDKIKKTNHGEK